MATDFETAGPNYVDSAACQQSLVPFLKYLLGRHERQGGATEIVLVPLQGGSGSKPMSGCFGPDDLDTLVELLRPEARSKVPRGQHPRIGEAAIAYNPHPITPAQLPRTPAKFVRCKPTDDVDIPAYSTFAAMIEPVR